MCCRSVFWEEESCKKLPAKSKLSPDEPLVCEKKEIRKDSQSVTEKRSMSPVLEGILDFLKGMSGIRPSST